MKSCFKKSDKIFYLFFRFATWMEYIGVNHIHPEWNMMDQFFLEVVSPALQLDSLTTSHPIQVTVKGFYKNLYVKSLFAGTKFTLMICIYFGH